MSILDQILEAARLGESASAIGKRFGLTAYRIKWLCQLAGIELPGRNRSRGVQYRNAIRRNPALPMILERLRNGESSQVIAFDVGLSRQRISQLAKAYDVPLTYKKVAKARRLAIRADLRAQKKEERKAAMLTVAKKAKELRESGYSWEEAARVMRMQTMTVYRSAMAHYPQLRERRFSPRGVK